MTERDADLISVVMPVRNEERLVERAVRSVLTQSHANLEVLVVDGRSDDRTREIVERVCASDPRVRLLDNPRLTIPAALNVGLAAAGGAFVARVDGHATVDPDYLRHGLEVLAEHPDVVAVGGKRIGVADHPTGQAVALALSSRLGVGDSINHYGNERVFTDHASFGIYRIGLAQAAGGWDEQLIVNEDVDFDHRLLECGGRIVYDPRMTIYWQVRDSVPQLLRQYRRYGRGKGAMVRKHGRRAVRARHLAPPLLIMLLGVAAGMLLAGRPRAATALVAPYAVAITTGSATSWRRRRRDVPTRGHLLPACFAAMHLGWGIGFVEGFVLCLAPASGSAVHPPIRGTKG